MQAVRRTLVLSSLIVLGITWPSPSAAQDASDAVLSAVREMESAAGSEVAVRRSPLTGLATFVAVRRGQGIPVHDGTPEARALAFVEAYGNAFGLADTARVEHVRTTRSDAVGMDHVRLRQVVQGVPVVGGEIMVHLRGARVVAANGKTLPRVDDLDTTPALGPAQAEERVLRFLEKHLRVTDATLGTPRLEVLNKGIFDRARRPTRLAWFVEATGPALREFVWVDARTGAIVLHFSQLPNALDRLIYTASGGSTLPGTLIGTETVPPTGDADAVAAFNFSGDTYDYYFTEHGRDSYDDAGASLISTVHYCPGSCPYANAFWNGVQMVYGNNFSRADDVDAHELTHAVTEHSANLYYYMQSGALNESFSDIFGETVDQSNGRGTDTAAVKWLMGEDLPGGAIRNMMNPNAFGDPGKMTDAQFFCGEGDRGGVHSNSGVPNHAFALMVDGGTYNGIPVSGIGLEKAGKVQYRALTEYLLTASDFLDDYDVLQQACSDLVGTAGITEGDCAQVRRALDAVQMAGPWPCALNGVRQAPVPAFCPAGQVPSNLFFDDLEAGDANWTVSTPDGPQAWYVQPATDGLFFATSGVSSWNGIDWDPYPALAGDSRLEMNSNVSVPSGDVRMQFNHSFDFEDFGYTYYDGGVVEYSTNNGTTWSDAGSLMRAGAGYGGLISNEFTNPLFGRPAFVGESWGYTASQLDLRSFAGQNVRFRFRIGVDDCVSMSETSTWQPWHAWTTP